MMTASRVAVPNNYNPYIHGATSRVLALLPKTHFQIMSPFDMIDKYKLAPITGELNAENAFVFGNAAQPAFGRLTVPPLPADYRGHAPYTLQSVLNSHAKALGRDDSFLRDQSALKEQLSRSKKCGFCNISSLLVEVVRAKQMGIPNSDFFSNSNMLQDQFVAELDAIIQFYYFVLLIGRNIHINYAAIKAIPKKTAIIEQDLECKASADSNSEENDVPDEAWMREIERAIYKNFSFENIFNRIIASHIDIRSIYENPSEEKIKHVISTLLPLSLSRKIDVFTTQSPPDDMQCDDSRYSVGGLLQYMPRNNYNFSIAQMLVYLIDKPMTSDFFESFHRSWFALLSAFQAKIDLFKAVVAEESRCVISAESECFTKKSFPLIFVVNDNNPKMHLVDSHTGEYRAQVPLQIDSDVIAIATDSIPHQKEVIDFLKHHQINRVPVLLLSQLEQAAIDKTDPMDRVRAAIKSKVEKYIKRIDSYRGEDGNINFSYGFCFFAQSRAKNREANYRFAQRLLQAASNRDDANLHDMVSMLRNSAQERADYLAAENFFGSYSNRGINSTELNSAIQSGFMH